jgi:hypothetical protein
MAIKFFADLNLNKSELQSVALETLSANPSSPSTGQIYFHTTDDEVKIYNGSSWQVVGKSYTAGGGLSLSGTEFSVDSTVIRTTGAQTKAGNMTFSNNVTITGNLTVNGTQTILNTAELAVEDTNIELNSGASAGADSGISVNRGQGEDVPQLLWDESADRWTFTNDGSTFYNMPLSTEYNNYSLPTATASVLGGVKIGSGISIASGVISADSQTANDFTDALLTKLNGVASSADNYGSWTISDGGQSETIGSGATLTISGDGATSTSYDQASNTLTISSTNTNTQLSTEQVQDIVGAMVSSNTETRIAVTYNDTTGKLNFVATDQSYTLPTASSSVLGGVKVGSNLSINAQGVLSASNTQLSTEQVQDITGAQLSAGSNVTIAYDDDGDGSITISSTDTNTQLSDAQVRSKISGTGLISYNSSTGVISTTANNYSLPTASASVLGGIKVGTNLSIDANGVLSATDTDTNTQLSNEQVQDIVGAMFSGNTETNITATYQDADGTIDLVATNTTYSAGDGLSLSGTTFTNAFETYVGSVTGATSISVDGTTHGVRYPATIQVYDNEGYQVFAETQMNTSTRDVSISGLASGDYDYVISGKRA